MDRSMGTVEGIVEVSSSDDGDEALVCVTGKKRSGSHEDFGEIHGNFSEQDYWEDDDDVIVIDKPICNFRRRKLRKKIEKEDEDDDCLLLESAPQGAVKVECVQSDVEELVVTGEVGPVACRDFPHSRHLCARFPFKTTSHLDHCPQCHCYVCETLAPCISWTIHCHASDKEGSWKELRKSKSAPAGFLEAHVNPPPPPTPVAVPILQRSPPVPSPRNPTRPTPVRNPSPRMADYALGNVRRFSTSPTTTIPQSPTAPVRFRLPSPPAPPRVRLPNAQPSHGACPTTVYRPNPQPDSPASAPSIPANVPMTKKVKLPVKKPRSSREQVQRHTKRLVQSGPAQGQTQHSNGQQVQVPGSLPPRNAQEALVRGGGLPSSNVQGGSTQVQAHVQGLPSSNGQSCVTNEQQLQVRAQGLPEQHVEVPAPPLNGQGCVTNEQQVQARAQGLSGGFLPGQVPAPPVNSQQVQVPRPPSEPRQVLPHSNGQHVKSLARRGQHIARRGSLPPPDRQVRVSLPNGQVRASLPSAQERGRVRARASLAPGQQAIPSSLPPVQSSTVGNSPGNDGDNTLIPQDSRQEALKQLHLARTDEEYLAGLQAFLEINQP